MTEPRIITDMPDVGCTQDGSVVTFTFVLDGSETQALACQFEQAGHIALGIQRAMQSAHEERLKKDPHADSPEISFPYDTKKLNVAISPEGEVYFLASTTSGFRIDLRVPKDIVKRLSEGLPSILENAKS